MSGGCIGLKQGGTPMDFALKQDGEAWLGSADADAVKIEWTVLKAPANAW